VENQKKPTAVADVADRRWREEKNSFAEQRKLPENKHLMTEELHEMRETLAGMCHLQHLCCYLFIYYMV